MSTAPVPAVRAQHDGGDRPERQPEPRGADGPGIDRDDDAGGEEYRVQRPATAAGGVEQRGGEQHPAGALRRDAPARQHRVAEGHRQCDGKHDRLARQPARQAPPRPPGQPPEGEPGDPTRDQRQHRHVHAGDGHLLLSTPITVICDERFSA